MPLFGGPEARYNISCRFKKNRKEKRSTIHFSSSFFAYLPISLSLSLSLLPFPPHPSTPIISFFVEKETTICYVGVPEIATVPVGVL